MAWEPCGHINPFETCLAFLKSNENVTVFEQIKGNAELRQHYIQKCTDCGCLAEFFQEAQGRYYCEIFQILDEEEAEPDSGNQMLN